MKCPACPKDVKFNWNFCPNCGYGFDRFNADDRAHIFESIMRVAKVSPDDWQGVCKDLVDHVGISLEEVQAELKQQSAEPERAKPELVNLNDKEIIDNIFSHALGYGPSERKRRSK